MPCLILQPVDKRPAPENGGKLLQLEGCRAAWPSARISSDKQVDLAQIPKILNAIFRGRRP